MTRLYKVMVICICILLGGLTACAQQEVGQEENDISGVMAGSADIENTESAAVNTENAVENVEDRTENTGNGSGNIGNGSDMQQDTAYLLTQRSLWMASAM